jgi:hypothetical protein
MDFVVSNRPHSIPNLSLHLIFYYLEKGESSVTRCYIFKQKIQIWINLGRSCKGRFLYFLLSICLFYGQMLFLWPFGTFSGHLVYFSRLGMLYREKSGNPGERRFFFFSESTKKYWRELLCVSPRPNPTKHNFPNIGKMSYKFSVGSAPGWIAVFVPR